MCFQIVNRKLFMFPSYVSELYFQVMFPILPQTHAGTLLEFQSKVIGCHQYQIQNKTLVSYSE